MNKYKFNMHNKASKGYLSKVAFYAYSEMSSDITMYNLYIEHPILDSNNNNVGYKRICGIKLLHEDDVLVDYTTIETYLNL